jgi:pimeloyl-ACP methyl ester carboxylesterase
LAPLVIKAQGSFFVGGDSKSTMQPAADPMPAQNGDITINQMYVQYQIPMKGERHVPVVMIHGCCLSAKSWETTPDGRMGWSEYFLRQDRSVYLVDQVSRARSGFDPTTFLDVRSGKVSVAQMPMIISSTHQLAWTVFRFGPKFGEVFPDQQFPMQAVDEFYKQMIPDLNTTLPDNPNPTWTQLAALGVKLNGAILMGHSEAGFFPEHAALIEPAGIKGIISIETQCETNLTSAQIDVLARIPTLVMFGDHLGDVTLPFASTRLTWADMLAGCRTFVGQLNKAGGDAEVMHLPMLGIKGNSHMLMQDRNNDKLANLIIAWIGRHIEIKQGDVHNHAK